MGNCPEDRERVSQFAPAGGVHKGKGGNGEEDSLTRALVTGGAGFLGSWLCELLINKGYEVVCLDNMSSGRRKNVEHLEGKIEVVEGDVTNPPPLPKADIIFHLASRASPVDFREHAIEILLANSAGTLRMLELAEKWGARFVFASSSEVYGNPLQHPQTEEYWGNVNPIGVRSCYDEGKRFGEALCMAYHRRKGLDVRIARIFNTYGPRMRKDDGRVISNFVVHALQGKPLTVYGDGTQTRSFCYVEDLVEGLFRLGEAEVSGEVFNLGNPAEVTILELARLVKRLTGTTSDIVFLPKPPDDPTRRRPDISKAKRLLNWEPKIPLEEGLKRTIEYFKATLLKLQ
jgi:nucleoside-diphosphate-sugar epimerase